MGLLLAAMALLPSVCFAAGENLLVNSGFDGGEMNGWGYSAWSFGDVYTAFDILPEGENGQMCAVVENYEANDARFFQMVDLEKNSYYRLSARVKFEGEGTANLSLLDTAVVSAFTHDTAGGWTTIETYLQTEKKQSNINVALRVGYYGRLEKGKAWFSDISLVKVDELPEGAIAQVVATIAPTTAAVEAPDKSGLTSAVLAALFTLAALAVYSFAARGEEPRDKLSRGLLAAILAAGFVVRAVIAYKTPGYEIDINCFGRWGAHLLSTGPLNFYVDGYFCDYPPGYMPVLALLSGITRLIGADYSDSIGQLILKTPAILCDIATCYLLYRIATRIGARGGASGESLSRRFGLAAAALYAFAPAVIADGAAWGQIDSVLTMLMLLSIWAMTERRMMTASVSFCVGLLMKPQALMFGPILLLAFIHEIYVDRKEGWKRLGVCFAVCAGIFIAVVLPFNGLRNPIWIWDLYTSTLGSYPYATVNAMNLFGLLGANWLEQGTLLGPLSYQAWGTVAMVLSILYAFYLYLAGMVKNGDRRALLVAALVILTGVFAFGVRMHERYVFPALALALAAFLLYRDRRFLYAFLGLSAAQTINILVVLAHQHVLAEDRFLAVVGGILHVACALYIFYLGYSVCIRGERERALPFRAPKRMVISVESPTLLRPGARDLKLHRVDILLMTGVTLAYTVLAFINLGDTTAPESKFRASMAGEEIVFDLGEERDITRFYYYGEIPEGTLQVAFTGDSGEFGASRLVEYKDNIMFVWKILDVNERARFAKVTFDAPGLTFFEFGFSGSDGVAYPVSIVERTGAREELAQDPALLIDEQAMVPVQPTYMNSMYFDEIYHARTAYEHINDMPWYENTHPPLGKVFMSWCIMAFGMNPFAWRLAGTVAGILMLPGMYLLGKLLFKRTELAFAAMFLMAVDCMHFAQTRIATIDSFPVLFIIWAFFFMFLYANMSYHHDKLSKTLPPLLASGLFMGLACASKWIGFYAAAGLAVVFFYTMGKRFAEYRQARAEIAGGNGEAHLVKAVEGYWFRTIATLSCCIIFFIGIPLVIYYFSYYQYLAVPGAGNDWRGVWNYQTHMLRYHSGVFDSHPYSSTWYQWPIIWKPMAFYFDYRMAPGWSSSISTFGNPAVWWAGLAAILWMIWRAVRGDAKRDPRILLVVIGFAAQYLPWVLVPRTTYIYHYFASVPFLILCICFFFEKLIAKGRSKLFIGYLVAAGVIFALFYPVASGLNIPIDLAKLVNWLPTWYLYWGA